MIRSHPSVASPADQTGDDPVLSPLFQHQHERIQGGPVERKIKSECGGERYNEPHPLLTFREVSFTLH